MPTGLLSSDSRYLSEEHVSSTQAADTDYRRFAKPEWVRLLGLLEMNVKYRRCLGTELFTEDGRVLLDFLSGYCVHNTGHNHPYIVQALIEELSAGGPAMLQSHVACSAGTLAERLTSLVGGNLTKVHFCSSGSEGVETVIKFARVFTGRTGFVYARGGISWTYVWCAFADGRSVLEGWIRPDAARDSRGPVRRYGGA